jgi:hypothetical protein
MNHDFKFIRWIVEKGFQIDPNDGQWFREVQDELTPDISIEITDEMLIQLYEKHHQMNKR